MVATPVCSRRYIAVGVCLALVFALMQHLEHANHFSNHIKTPASLLSFLVFRLQQNTYDCKDQRRFGWERIHSTESRGREGGWNVCFDTLPTPESLEDRRLSGDNTTCHIISIGIDHGQDFSFERGLHESTGCSVHAFDPQLGKADRVVGEDVTTHPFAIGVSLQDPPVVDQKETETAESGKGRNPEDRWKIRTLSWVYETYHTEHVPLLKVDIEERGWSVIMNWISTNALSVVDQLLINFRIHATKEARADPEELVKILKGWNTILDQLGAQGFKVHWGQVVPESKMEDFGVGYPVPCCYKVSFVRPPGFVSSYIRNGNWVPSFLSDKGSSAAIANTDNDEETSQTSEEEDTAEDPDLSDTDGMQVTDDDDNEDDDMEDNNKLDENDMEDEEDLDEEEDGQEDVTIENVKSIVPNLAVAATGATSSLPPPVNTTSSTLQPNTTAPHPVPNPQFSNNKMTNANRTTGAPIMEDFSVTKPGKVDLFMEAVKATFPVPEKDTKKADGTERTEVDVLSHGRLVEPERTAGPVENPGTDSEKDDGEVQGDADEEVFEEFDDRKKF